MKCEIEGCEVSPSTGGTLFRTSPMGEDFVGRCKQHLTVEQREELDPEVVRLTRIISEARP